MAGTSGCTSRGDRVIREVAIPGGRLLDHGNTDAMPDRDHDGGRSDLPPDWPGTTAYPVLPARGLVARTHTGPLIELLRIKLGFPAEFFVTALMPVVERYSEFVQLLPAMESGENLRPGGRLSHGLALAARVLDRRRARILPRGAAPETIGEHAHRWTYAVVVAALLHDATKLAGVSVEISVGGGRWEVWNPHLGSMLATGASTYTMLLDEHRPIAKPHDTALAQRCFETWVPDRIKVWLAGDADLMAELRIFLETRSGNPRGAFSDLIQDGWTCRAGISAPTPRGTPAVPRRAANPGPARMPDERVDGEGVSESGSTGVLLLAPVVGSSSALRTTERGCGGNASRHAVEPRDERIEMAWRFMEWLREGIADGTIRVNEPRALVHGVDQGLLLVSPRIFRTFVERTLYSPGARPADIGKSAKRVQRCVLRAGWHLQAPGGIHMRTYRIAFGELAGTRLSGVVIRDPSQFIDPAPAVDTSLVSTPVA